MIYFEANVTTTIPNPSNSINKYKNSSMSNHGNTNSGIDYPQQDFGQGQSQIQHQLVVHQQTQHQQTQHQQTQHQQSQHQHQQTQLQPAQNQGYRQTGYNSKFTPQDIQVLKQLLTTGEKYKWKQITKEINYQAAGRKNILGGQNTFGGSSDDSTSSNSYIGASTGGGKLKNVSPTFVIKQYQSLLGLPNNSMYFGLVGSSLPYVVGPNGWDDIPNLPDIYDTLTDNKNDVD